MQSLAAICPLLAAAIAFAPNVAAQADIHSYPIRYIDNRIFVDATVNGVGPLAFLLDTGTTDTFIDNALMKRLKLKPKGGGQTGGAGEKTVPYKTVHLKSLTLGDLSLGALDVGSLDGRPLAHVIGFQQWDGTLGTEIFTGHVITLDVSNSRLTVEDNAEFITPIAATRVPMELNGDNMPVIDGAINGLDGHFVIDTGDRSSLTIFGPFWRAHALDRQIGQTVTAMTGYGIGGPIRGVVGRPASFVLGGIAVPPPVTRLSLQKSGAFATADYAGSIGMGILQRFIVSFDYANKAMWLTKSADFVKPDLYDRSGMWLAFGEGRGLAVRDITDGSPAAAAGLKAGDVVSAVDDLPANWDSLFKLRALLRQPDKAQAIVGVARGGKPLSLTVGLHDLIAPAGAS